MFRHVASSVVKSHRRSRIVGRHSNRRRLFLESLEDRRVLAVITLTPVAIPSPTVNDYTVINDAINEAASDGDTIELAGTFDWTEPNAAASWELGSDGVLGTDDDYSILVEAGLDGVTLTAATLGAATIQGPGDVPTFDFDAFIVLWTPGVFASNQDWTISNLQILDFDNGIGMFFDSNDEQFNGTTITNNHILVAEDTIDDGFHNIGIHYSFGQNQTISNNVIDLSGGGMSDSGNFAVSVGIQSNTKVAATSTMGC